MKFQFSPTTNGLPELRTITARDAREAAGIFTERLARKLGGKNAWGSGPCPQGQMSDGSQFDFSTTIAAKNGSVIRECWFSVIPE